MAALKFVHMATYTGNADVGAKKVLQREVMTTEFKWYFLVCGVLTENAL